MNHSAGKWVGYLTSENGQVEYDNKTGRSFPYIHYIANGIVEQEMNYKLYCQIALGIRGALWALLLYLPLIAFDYTSILNYTIVSLAYAIGSPIACWLSVKWYINYQSRYLNLSQGWEMQEVYYGVVHMLCNWYLIYKLI